MRRRCFRRGGSGGGTSAAAASEPRRAPRQRRWRAVSPEWARLPARARRPSRVDFRRRFGFFHGLRRRIGGASGVGCPLRLRRLFLGRRRSFLRAAPDASPSDSAKISM
jgi:hypothetical protein